MGNSIKDHLGQHRIGELSMGFNSRWSISRRDNNDEALAKEARKLGCLLLKAPPLDYWIWWAGSSNHWIPMDIKDPKKQGHADEFTDAQRKFMQQAKELGSHYEIWRTLDDVIASHTRAMVRA